VQCYSGLLISNRTITPAQYILILQPPIEAAPEVETEKARDIKEPEPDTPLISEPEEIKKTDPLPSIQFSLVPIPGIIIKESVITAMNASFQEWSGIHEGNLPEYAPVLLSHAVQARENRSLVLSSVSPAGLKTYQKNSRRIHTHQSGLFWFLDQTEAQESIANLKTRIENLSSELTSVTNNLQEERSAIKGSDDISRQIDIVEFELSGGRYAMDIGMVREVVEMLPITPLPKAPPYIIGIINLRGGHPCY
jgi:purine-binding chemotaxis protein CheW